MNKTTLDVFDPPEGLIGHTAVLVAMSADQDVLDEILARFTGLGHSQRQAQGRLCAFLLLDRAGAGSATKVIQPDLVPGLCELYPRQGAATRRLLHAKVALLRYVVPGREQEPSLLRLAVFTGNFTRASLRHHLELVWCVEIDEYARAPAADRADVGAAAGFVRELLTQRFHIDENSPLTADMFIMLDRIKAILPSTVAQRFIHSLNEPLLGQIGSRFDRFNQRAGKTKDRNVLICGSGSFEQTSGTGRSSMRKPEVLQALEKLPGLSPNAHRRVIVHPQEAGAIAHWKSPEDWTITTACDARENARRLHAKFIYVGWLQGNHLSNGWLYLGSGNLTKMGLQVGVAGNGNIECGVVIDVPKRMSPEEVQQCLFCNLDAADVDSDELKAGQDEAGTSDPPDDPPPPILWVRVNGAHLDVGWRDDFPQHVPAQLSWGNHTQVVTRGADSIPVDAVSLPPFVGVSIDQPRTEWKIPVIGADGRIAWMPPRYDTVDDVLDAVTTFPLSVQEEPIDDEVGSLDDGTRSVDSATSSRRADQAPSYPMRDAAMFIERIAAKQAMIPKDQIDGWIAHLRLTLEGIHPDHQTIKGWRERNLPVFEHLAHEVFAPQPLTDEQRQRYRVLLKTVAVRWGFSHA